MNRERFLILENAKKQARAAKIRRAEEKRETLHQWAASTLTDIKALAWNKEACIVLLLERAEEVFDLRQDLS